MLEPVVEDVVGFDVEDSGPDSGPEVKGDEGRGAAYEKNIRCQVSQLNRYA